MPDRSDKSLLRSLGEFFGHIAHGIKTDPAKGRTVTKKTIEHESRETPQGKVLLRRTIIEEVELPPGHKPQGGSDTGKR